MHFVLTCVGRKTLNSSHFPANWLYCSTFAFALIAVPELKPQSQRKAHTVQSYKNRRYILIVMELRLKFCKSSTVNNSACAIETPHITKCTKNGFLFVIKMTITTVTQAQVRGVQSEVLMLWHNNKMCLHGERS